jgi:hypothetical protein
MDSVTKMVLFFLKNIGFYGLAIIGGFIAIDKFGLAEAVITCKLVSLGGLIVVSEGISREITAADKDIRRWNRVIVTASIVLLVLLVLELLFVKIDASRLRGQVHEVVQFAFENIYWVSAIPIFAYAALNYWVGFLRGKNDEIEYSARCFFVFADCTCAMPLLFVLTLAWIFHQSQGAPVDTFVNGAMAMIIFASNIVTKALDLVLPTAGDSKMKI